MSGWCVLFVVLTTCTVVCLAGDVCYSSNDDFFYCEWGCCDSLPNQKCCSFAVWIIVLSIIGGISLIAVAIFVFCICVCQKRARARAGAGRVIQTHDTQQPVVNYAGNTFGVQGQVNQAIPSPAYSFGNAKY